MYGLVNNGIRTFIAERYGEEMWHAICRDAGLDDPNFESMLSYEDKVTHDLVGAICRHLDLTAAEVLEVFGEFWVGFAHETAIGQVMQFQGDTFLERLAGLDEMHDQVRLAMPHLVPPSFEFEEGADGVHRLHYHSHREGLQPMVIGLLKGLSEQTGVGVEVTLVESRADGHDHDVFELRVSTAGDAAGEAA